MYSPKLRPQMASREENKQNDEGCCTVRCWLLIWAFPRLAVSVLWTSVIVLATLGQLLSDESREPPSRLFFGAYAIVIQLVEFGMLVTFIVAGFKKSVTLYVAYFRYCILTLIIYIISVILCFSLDYNYGHYFGEIYLFYHYYDVVAIDDGNDVIPLLCAFILDIALEILLIFAIKRCINKYRRYGNDYEVSENV